MGRFNPTEERAENPAEKNLSWNGRDGNMAYYDEDAEDFMGVKSGNFVVLNDDMYRVKSPSKEEVSIRSNYFTDFRDQEVVLTEDGTPFLKGSYSEVKNVSKQRKGALHRCLILFWEDEIVRLELKGTALYEYNNFRKKCMRDKKDFIYGDFMLYFNEENTKKETTSIGNEVFVPVWDVKSGITIKEETLREAAEQVEAWVAEMLKGQPTAMESEDARLAEEFKEVSDAVDTIVEKNEVLDELAEKMGLIEDLTPEEKKAKLKSFCLKAKDFDSVTLSAQVAWEAICKEMGKIGASEAEKEKVMGFWKTHYVKNHTIAVVISVDGVLEMPKAEDAGDDDLPF